MCTNSNKQQQIAPVKKHHTHNNNNKPRSSKKVKKLPAKKAQTTNKTFKFCDKKTLKAKTNSTSRRRTTTTAPPCSISISHEFTVRPTAVAFAAPSRAVHASQRRVNMKRSRCSASISASRVTVKSAMPACCWSSATSVCPLAASAIGDM